MPTTPRFPGARTGSAPAIKLDIMPYNALQATIEAAFESRATITPQNASAEIRAGVETVLGLLRKHVEYTDSARGRWVLDHWDEVSHKFVKIMPLDYKLALEKLKEEAMAAHG